MISYLELESRRNPIKQDYKKEIAGLLYYILSKNDNRITKDDEIEIQRFIKKRSIETTIDYAKYKYSDYTIETITALADRISKKSAGYIKNTLNEILRNSNTDRIESKEEYKRTMTRKEAGVISETEVVKTIEQARLSDAYKTKNVQTAVKPTILANYIYTGASVDTGRKTWNCLFLPTSRDAHKQASGQVEFNGKFMVGGEELAYPGDPNGSIGNIANCHCFIQYNL